MLAPIAGQLKTAVLRGCERINNELCGLLDSIEFLDLSFTNVNDEGLDALADASTGPARLKQLVLAEKRVANLWMTGPWTERGLERFQAARAQVVVSFVLC